MPIFFRPYRSLTSAPVSRGPADLALVARLEQAIGAPIARDPEVDFEDWMEPACVLDALIAEGVAVQILERGCSLLAPVVAFDVPGTPVEPIVVLGRLSAQDDRDLPSLGAAWPLLDQEDKANRYAETRAFARHAQRRFVLADMPGEPTGALPFVDAHQAMVGFAGARVVVKQTRPAKASPVTPIDLPAGLTDVAASRLLFDAFEWNLVRFEGLQRALLVQEHVPMAFETRLFVVGGKVVAGAGCVEAHTPLDSAGDAPVSPFVEAQRNQGPVLAQPHTRDLLAAFGQQVAAELAAEGLTDCTLDVAMGTQGPLVLECNPCHNAGLYATPVRPLVQAILARAQDRHAGASCEAVVTA